MAVVRLGLLLWMVSAASAHGSSHSLSWSEVPRWIEHEIQRLSGGATDARSLSALARLSFYSGHFQGSESYRKGRAFAADALKLAPHSVEARFWWAVHEAKLAAIERSLASLRSLREIERVLRGLSQDAPEYGRGAADRVLGKIYAEAPRWISIGSDTKAEHHLRRALEMFPDYAANRLAYAHYLAGNGQNEIADRYIRSFRRGHRFFHRDPDPFALDAVGWPAMLCAIQSCAETDR